MVKSGDAIGVWLGARAKAGAELARAEAENEISVNEGFTPEAAAGAVLAQDVVRQAMGKELSSLEREFRLAAQAAVTKQPALERVDASDPKLATSRARVKRLLTAAAATK